MIRSKWLLVQRSGPSRDFKGPEAKEKDKAPVREASRKFSESRNELWEVTAGLLYEDPTP